MLSSAVLEAEVAAVTEGTASKNLVADEVQTEDDPAPAEMRCYKTKPKKTPKTNHLQLCISPFEPSTQLSSYIF